MIQGPGRRMLDLGSRVSDLGYKSCGECVGFWVWGTGPENMRRKPNYLVCWSLLDSNRPAAYSTVWWFI